MRIRCLVTGMVLAAATGTEALYGQTTATGSGQAFPVKPIRLLVGEPGGSNDVAGRLISQGLSGPLGQQVIVENRATVGPELVVRSQPDGYTLLYYGSPLWIRPLMRAMPFDPVKDFAPVTMVASTPNVLIVHPALPVKSVQELIALGKQKPGALNYSSGSVGSPNHIAAELFKSMAGVDFVRIPYKGGGPAVSGLIAGQVQMMFATAGSAVPSIKSGRVIALAVTSAEPSALLPSLPTVAASGLPGYESTTPYGIFAPAKTPAAVINRLNLELVRYLKTGDAIERFLNAGLEPAGTSPEHLTATMKSEMTRLGKLIKDAGIREE